MAKCIICEKKSKRLCSAIGGSICSFCCGTKRQKEINCFTECEFLKQGQEYQDAKEISREVNAHFNIEEDDILQHDADVIVFVSSLENFFIEKFYNDKRFDDSDIYRALSKLYSYQTERADFPKNENECGKLIFEKFKKLDKKYSDFDASTKKISVLRILKSIKLSSGGFLGNRNYLEMIYSQFNPDGKWSQLFSI
jgi:hypothetical protein